MKTMMCVLIVCVALLSGCDPTPMNESTIDGFNDLPCPVVIVACNEGGLAVLDGCGNLHTWAEKYYFVQPFLKCDLKKGDVLLPEK